MTAGNMVQNCTFSGCSASAGGGVYCNSGGTVQNCTFSGCSSVNSGGGVQCNNGGTVQNCTFSDCSASAGGGVYCFGGGTVQNCSIIRAGGTTNSVYTGGSAAWMSVWTNVSANGFVTYSTSLNN